MEHSHEKKRKCISIDLTKGRRIFDTSKMDEWSPEEWTAFVGTEEDQALEILLLNTDAYRFLITTISMNEVTKVFTVEFQMENKTEKDLRIDADELKVDDALFDVSQTAPLMIKPHAEEEWRITVTTSGGILEFFKRSISLSLDLKDGKTERWLEGYEFFVKVY